MKRSAHRLLPHFLLQAIIAVVLMVTASCLRDMPEEIPEGYTWEPQLAFPVGSESFGMNVESGFDTTLFDLDTITGFPEWVDEFQLEMEGSVEFDFYSISGTPDRLDRILFRFNIYNDFPHEALVQIEFMNYETIIDSMFSEKVAVPAAQIADNGEVKKAGYTRRDAVFDQERIDGLVNTSDLLFRAVIENPEVDTNLINSYPGYEIEVDLGCMVDLTIDF
jgi:hypothetical protein